MATYEEIQKWIRSEFGFIVKSCWLAHVKEVCNLPLRLAPNRKDRNKRTNPCPLDKRGPILAALIKFGFFEDIDKIVSLNSRWIAALHEAGHAIVHWKLGGRVNYLYIERSEQLYSGGANVETFDLETVDGRHRELMVALAGEAAVSIMEIPDSIRNSLAGIEDWSRARIIVRQDCLNEEGFINDTRLELLMDSVYQEVLSVLQQNKSAVLELAERLLAHPDDTQMPFPWDCSKALDMC